METPSGLSLASPDGGGRKWRAERTAFVSTDGHPATGKRGSTAHHQMIHPIAYESGAATPPPEKFPLGQVVATPGALDAIPQDEMQIALRRHHSGDWGDLDEHDKLENERGLREGFRLFSAYRTKAGVRFYIITEHDRSVTTVLLPDEY